jgi:hypothetical protein
MDGGNCVEYRSRILERFHDEKLIDLSTYTPKMELPVRVFQNECRER